LKRNVLILALFTACSTFALGQAAPDATRAGDLQVGGTFTFAYSDYSPQDSEGGGAYAAFDFKPNYGVEADFHFININQHSGASELSYEIGPRYHRTYGRYNPYVKALGGRGTFDFAPAFQELGVTEHYWMLTGGAGLDYQLTYRFNLRAEVEYQHWFTNGNSGPQTPPTGPTTGEYLPHGLTPILYQFGFAYHFSGGAPSY
jgi:hypothetical protein